MLIAKQADIEAKTNKGNTPLLLASGIGLTDVVMLLADKGADLSAMSVNTKGRAKWWGWLRAKQQRR